MLMHDEKRNKVKKYIGEALSVVTDVLGEVLLPDDKIAKMICSLAEKTFEKTADIVRGHCQNLSDDKRSALFGRLENEILKFTENDDDTANVNLNEDYYNQYFNGKSKSSKTSEDVRKEIHKDIEIYTSRQVQISILLNIIMRAIHIPTRLLCVITSENSLKRLRKIMKMEKVYLI